MRNKIGKLLAVLLAAVLLSTSTSASTAEPGDPPPDPVGVTPVSQDAVTHLGSLVGQNGSSTVACTVNGRNLLTITGDFTAYIEHQGVTQHPALKAVVIDADTGAFVWGASGINATEWVHTSACANGRIYFGGTFTSFMGVSRARTAAIDATTFELTPWQSSFSSGKVWNIKSSGGDLFVAGLDVVRRVTDAGAQVWSRGFDCGVRSVELVGGHVYVGGGFDAIKRPGTTSVPARGLAALDSVTGEPLGSQPTGSLPNTSRCKWDGANPLSLDYSTQRGALFVCEGGGLNRVRSVDVATGATVWAYDISGDGQACEDVQGFAFVGFHRSGDNVIPSESPNWGTMGMMRNGDDGTQAIWEPSPDFAGAGQNNDDRNNGIIGADYANGHLYVTGGFKSVSGENKLGIAAFPVGDQPIEEPAPDPDPGTCGEPAP